MPTLLQYPLERSRDIQRQWDQVLRRYETPHSHTAFINTIPPRDPEDDDEDDEDEDEPEDDLEPGAIREPDEDG